MKVLILGASGQIGICLSRFMEMKGAEVTGTSRRGDKGLVRFDPFNGNWEKLGRFDCVVNCCGIILEKGGLSFSEVHGGITEKILVNRKFLGNPAVIQVSVLGADINSDVPFFRTKAEADQRLLGEPDTWVLRPSIVCTPGTMMVKKFRFLWEISRLSGGFVFLPAGMAEHRMQPVMGEDLAEVCYNIAVGGSEKRTLEITGPEEFTYRELFHILSEVNAKDLKLLELPERLVRFIVKKILDPVYPDLISYGQYRMIFSDSVADNSTVREILGREMQDTREFWREEFDLSKKNKKGR